MGNKLFLLLFLTVTTLFSKEILVLHSYHKGYEWSDSISAAIENQFKNSDVTLTTEYMDTKRIYNNNYLQKLAFFYQTRYQDRKFDLIIASDNNALNFLNQYKDTLFQNTPIVFCGINNFSKEYFQKLDIAKYTTGVVESIDIKKNLDLIHKLHPKLEKLLVINDTTITGQEMKKEFFSVLSNYKDTKNIEYIDNYEIKDLQKKLQQLPKNSAILFMLLFKDNTQEQFDVKQSIKIIQENAKYPIYGLWDFYLGDGLVGGYLTYGYNQGRYGAKLAKEILEGKTVQEVPIIANSPNKFIFDYRALKKFNIDKKYLPSDAIIINQPFDFYKTYKTQITFVVIIFILFVIVIFFLVISLLEKKRAKKELQVQLNFIETLLNTINNPIFYKDKNGKYIGCNDAFCTFIGKPKEGILGKTMYDFFGKDKEFLKAHETIEQKLFNHEEVEEYILDYNLNDTTRKFTINKSLFHGTTNKNIEGILTILHDITELSNIEKEKKQHESFLVQQSKLAEIGEMISAIAHQWNEPLVEISAIVQDLELQYKTEKISDKDIKDFVTDSMIQIQYMSKTLKDFRDFLKPSVKKSIFNIEDAFNEVLNIIERQIKYSYIDLKINYKTDFLEVYGYKNEFMQVLITLLHNSKDAIGQIKSQDKHYKGFIETTVFDEIDYLTIHIQDNGCGLRDKDKKNLFNPYHSTKPKGNGLGLYMSKILIEEKMDGKIYFDETQKLTTIVIELPKRINR